MNARTRLERIEKRLAERERPENIPLQSFADLARAVCAADAGGPPVPARPLRPGEHSLWDLAEIGRAEREAFAAKMAEARET